MSRSARPTLVGGSEDDGKGNALPALAGGGSVLQELPGIVKEVFEATLAAVPQTATEAQELSDHKAALVVYQEEAAKAEKRRREHVEAAIRQAAVGMTADALIHAAGKMQPLHPGTLVRVSLSHMDMVVRRTLHTGIKRGRDLATWSSELFYILEASDATPSGRAANSYPHYKVAGVGRPADEAAIFYPLRQDLLAVGPLDVPEGQLDRLRRGETAFLEGVVVPRPGAAARPFLTT